METEQRKKVGLITATSLVVGNMIGSGLFMLPAALAAYGGISLVGWVVSGLGAMSLAIVYGWLAKLHPKTTGGPYAYTYIGMGDFAAFLVAWGYWISVWCANAAITVAFVSYLSAFVPALATDPSFAIGTGLAAIWLLTWVNTLGIREAGAVQVLTTILKLVPLLLIAVAGLFYIRFEHFTPFNLSTESSLGAVTSTTTLTLFAYLGLECATIPSENIANAQKTVARATLLGTYLTTAVYILSTIAVMGLIPPDLLRTSQAPFADAAASIWGEPARYLVAAAAVIATFGALNGWILVQGQVPFAAARDRLFPAVFSKENKKGVPGIGIVISSVLVSLLMGMNFTNTLADTYKYMILLSTLTVLVPYVLSMASYAIIITKDKAPNRSVWPRLFVAFLGFLFSLWAIVGSGREIVYWGFIMLIAGIPFYVVMKFKKEKNSL
ncbi:MAG: amino acid permease [Ignavibacteriales bacterium]|nr:amino acid permease [Ignavibacteriales bacterium]